MALGQTVDRCARRPAGAVPRATGGGLAYEAAAMGRQADRRGAARTWGGQPLGRRFGPAPPDGGDRLFGEARPRDPHALLARRFLPELETVPQMEPRGRKQWLHQ